MAQYLIVVGLVLGAFLGLASGRLWPRLASLAILFGLFSWLCVEAIGHVSGTDVIGAIPFKVVICLLIGGVATLKRRIKR